MKPTVSIWTTSLFPFDQRLQKMAAVFKAGGADVTIWDRYAATNPQGKIRSRHQDGVRFYMEYNFNISRLLASHPTDIVYAADIDVMPGLLWGHRQSGEKPPLILDLHEWFPEVIELQGKPLKKKIWQQVESYSVRSADMILTVNSALKDIFENQYKRPVSVVRNLPYKNVEFRIDPAEALQRKILYYQGAVNEGRGLEEVIDAMLLLPDWQLWVAGSGDIFRNIALRVKERHLQNQVRLLGQVKPEELPALAQQATLGLNLLSDQSKSYYYSLANKFLDYIQVGLPSVNMDFPEYRRILREYETGIMVKSLRPEEIARSIRDVMADKDRYYHMNRSAIDAAEVFTWENESEVFNRLLKNHPRIGLLFDWS